MKQTDGITAKCKYEFGERILLKCIAVTNIVNIFNGIDF
jgi:hypothetical protein